MQDALELVDRTSEDYFDHDMYTPHILRCGPEQKKALKMQGSIVIPGHHVVKVCLDHRF